MILIQSTSDDFSTSTVAQWLCHQHTNFTRLNDKSTIIDTVISDGAFQLKIGNNDINLKEVKKFWYRRGHFEFESLIDSDSLELNTKFKNYNKTESSIVINMINKYLQEDTQSIGDYQTSKINKIVACEIAKKQGLRVPDYLITTSKKELEHFYTKHTKIISKSIYGLPGFATKNISYNAKTQIISSSDIEESTDDFGVSLFQEYIEKKIELRVFFLKDEFYASAIFSQNDAQTKVDFRNYNRSKPNRVIPYKLPIDIIEKLKIINQKLSLNSGSYDLILTPENEYCFLEVNPIGQFAQVSLPCNYYLEKEIAKELSNG